MMEHFEKKLDSERIYEGRVVNLRRDRVELEDGKIAYREVIEHPGGVCVVAIDAENNLFFVRQFRYAVGELLLELPAGKLERGEDPVACGMRELEEECGMRADMLLPLAKFYPTCAYDEEIIHIYFAQGLHPGKQRLDPGEFLTVEKIPVEKAVRMALDGSLIDGKTQLGILKFMALRSAGLL